MTIFSRARRAIVKGEELSMPYTDILQVHICVLYTRYLTNSPLVKGPGSGNTEEGVAVHLLLCEVTGRTGVCTPRCPGVLTRLN